MHKKFHANVTKLDALLRQHAAVHSRTMRTKNEARWMPANQDEHNSIPSEKNPPDFQAKTPSTKRQRPD
ncbi:hypothetical protein E3N88_20727 [Mikania micrantha]|uniref:Uncharacterized protein n=1 Tax=Mikania micrantha TaxID=192012 RepID=A0A5N6NI90_9ASTR|nr:hypothetical protein E3N88_20727 [Mikania micrantha]